MMNNSMFPNEHTTTTTITQSETQVNPTIRYDKQYLYTVNGQLKLLEIISSSIALIFVSISSFAFHNVCTFFLIVAVAAVWWNTILLVFYLFHVVEKFYKIPWLKVELLICAIFSALYFLAALLALTSLYPHFIFFFFLTVASGALTALFAYDSYIKFQALQSGEIAQGKRVINHTHVEQPPVYRY